MSYGVFAFIRYFVRLMTLVVVSISPKFSILASLPMVVDCRAVKASMFLGRSSGFSSVNCSEKSGM